MDIQKVTADYRASKWGQVIQERQASGQSIIEFCREKGLSRNAYFYWQRKLKKAVCTELSKLEEPANYVPNGWIELAQGQEMEPTLEIEIGGCRVRANHGTDPELLKKVCRILRVL